jgi:hypothetical protein
MCEYLKLKTEIWNLHVKRLEFEILKLEMSEFGCVNIECWKLKFEISSWNVWKEFENLKTEMSEYWKLKCLNTKNWNVWILKTESWIIFNSHFKLGSQHTQDCWIQVGPWTHCCEIRNFKNCTNLGKSFQIVHHW